MECLFIHANLLKVCINKHSLTAIFVFLLTYYSWVKSFTYQIFILINASNNNLLFKDVE